MGLFNDVYDVADNVVTAKEIADRKEKAAAEAKKKQEDKAKDDDNFSLT